MNFFSSLFKPKPPAPAPAAEEEIFIPRLLSYQIGNLQGVGTRKAQEDSFSTANAMDVTEIKRSGLFAVVADGMGGMQNGKAASETAVQCLRQDFLNYDRSGNLPAQMYSSVIRASDLIFNNFGGQSGTTVIECIIYNEMLYFISVGDSYLYLKRGGRMCRLNKEHNYRHVLYMEEIKDGGLDRSKADTDPDSPRLSEFVGKDVIEEVDILYQPMQLYDGDTIFIASDGVGGVVDEDTLYQCLELPMEQACHAIEQEIVRQNRKYQDNYTALIIKCGY